MQPELITFQTADSVTIVGKFAKPENAARAALLLHMMPATKESYDGLAKALNKNGFATLAIDLRGHGESRNAANGETLDYTKFENEQHQASRLDVDAAFNFLAQKGFAPAQIGLVGASIGANLTLDAMARYKEILRGALLSPGLDYRGVTTEQPIRALEQNQKVWIIVGEDDEYSAESSRKLQSINPIAATLTIFEGADHGTNLFNPQPNLINDIVKFLNS